MSVNETNSDVIQAAPGGKRIIPSIYTGETIFGGVESRIVLDYATALNVALQYQEAGADEVIFMDVTALTERRRNLPKFLKDAAARLTIPFVFGGGVNTVTDVEELIKYGAKRIYVNSAAVKNPELVNKVSTKYGPERLLVAIDTRQSFGHWKVYLNGGKSRTEIDLLNWVDISEKRGAGEILISTVSKEYADHELIHDLLNQVAAATSLPILTAVGVNDKADFARLFQIKGISGVVAGTYFLNKQNSIKEVKAYLEAEFNQPS